MNFALTKFTPCACLALTLISASPIAAQLLLNKAPTRVIGQTSLTISSSNPNLVEGREFYAPQGIALDPTASPPYLYVADTLNNRVLGFRNALAFKNGQKADIVLGQSDFKSTFPQGGPRSARTTGFATPTGLAVDPTGNLYVVDSGNNRILRFPRPFSQTGDQLPDLVLGQKSFATNAANQGLAFTAGATASTLNYISNSTTGTGTLISYPAFDSAGNLWVPDPGNNRILRFSKSKLSGSPANGPDADVVLGQTDFQSNTFSPASGSNPLTSLRAVATPAAIAFDTGGRMFISESRSGIRSRILVYSPPFNTGQPATRLLGVDLDSPPPPIVSEYQLAPSTGGMFSFGDNIGIADSQNNRILIFSAFGDWTSNQLYQPAQLVVGQPDFSSSDANQKQPETSGDRLRNPATAVFYGTELFVVDSGNHRIIPLANNGGIFTPAARVLGQDALNLNGINLVEGRGFAFNVSGSADMGMVTDFTSSPPRLYIADTYNNRVLCYRDLRNVRPGDKPDFVIGQPDFQRNMANYPANDANIPTSSSLFLPIGLTLDQNGNLYVADTGNSRVLRFPKPFENFVAGVMPQADLVLGQLGFGSKITDPTTRTMSAPYGVAFASTQGLMVSDISHNRVLYFQGRPEQLQSGQPANLVFGQSDFFSSGAGNDDSHMNAPRHIAVDSDDRLYITDTGNSRLLIFDHAPTAGPGAHAALSLGGFASPRGIFVNNVTGEIWVADSAANSVSRFPKFNDIPAQGFTTQTLLNDVAPIGVTQDIYGNVYIADAFNRVIIHFPGVAAINAANYLNLNMAPGMIAALFASNVGTKQFGGSPNAFSSVPLPKQLNGLQVTLNDVACPLFYADNSQINIQIPWSTPTSGTANLAVVEVATGRVVGAAIVPLSPVSPGLFTSEGSGKGPAAAINADGTINSLKNPAAQGSYVTLYGTGQGIVQGPLPKDGDVVPGPQSSPRAPTVIMNTGFIPDGDIQYSGLAPTLVGVWQVNAKVPDNAPPTSAIAPPIQVIVVLDSVPSGGGGLGRPVTLYVKQKN